MFQKVVLKNDAWYSKLQKWTFGDIPFDSNFCPFFWLTIFCMLIVPLTLLWKGLGIVGGLLIGTAEFMDEKWFTPRFERDIDNKAKNMTDDDAYYLFNFIFYSLSDYKTLGKWNTKSSEFRKLKGNKGEKLLAIWRKWKSLNEDWEAKLNDAQERNRKKEEALRVTKEKSEARKRKFFSILVRYTKYLALLPAGILLIYLSYGVALVILLMIENWSTVWPQILIALGMVTAIASLIAGVFYLIEVRGISAPRPLKSTFDFFGTYIQTFKEDNCPAIEWE